MSKRKNTPTPGKRFARTDEPKALPAAIRTGLWAPWGYAPPPKEGAKPPKIPVYLDQCNVPIFVGTDAAEHWTDYGLAAAALAKVASPKKDKRTGAILWEKAGLGRLCASEPELTVIDVDDCLGTGGKPNSAAAQLVKLAATYTEVSPSGNGLRLALKGSKPEAIRLAEVGNVEGTRVEIYDATSTRYVTFTGNVLPGTKATVAGWSKGFAKWIEANWTRGKGGAARGSLRLTTEQRLAELQEGFAMETDQTIKFNVASYLKSDGTLDRSAAFASLFSRLYGSPEVGAAEALAVTLNTLGDNLADKGTRKVIIADTNETAKVPFAVADAAKIATIIEERFDVKRALDDNLRKVTPAQRVDLVRGFYQRYPQHSWHVAYVAINRGVRVEDVRCIVGDETVQSVGEYMQSLREREGRRT